MKKKERKKFKEKIRKNEILYQEALKEKYSAEKLFKQKEPVAKAELPVERKNFLLKLIDKIKSIFRRKE